MKKLFMPVLLIAAMLFAVSCGGQKADTKKMIKKMEKITSAIEDAADDGEITDKEADKINKKIKDMEDFSNKVQDKYDDEEKAAEIMEELGEEIMAATMELMAASQKLSECDGGDKIDMN